MVPTGTLVLVEDRLHSFLPAQVVRAIGLDGEGEVEILGEADDDAKAAEKRRVRVQSRESVAMMDPEVETGVANMVSLRELNEASILHNLRVRFARDEIYTSVGSILVAINPFKLLPLYTPEVLEAYKSDSSRVVAAAGSPGSAALPPHVFQIADAAYKALLANHRDQSCIISGESGAGKTETTKLFLQFLTEASSAATNAQTASADADCASVDVDFGLQERILQANPLMEAFGNAKTVRNNNSSRFGKWIQIRFDPKLGAMRGGQITSYLLEKSRIVHQGAGERNYHVFYQLCAAADADEGLRRRTRLAAPDDYHYLNQSETYSADGINDEREWERLLRAFEVIKVTQEEVDQCIDTLAAILHLGNVDFDERDDSGDGKAVVRNGVTLDICAELLGVERPLLERVLTTRSVGVRSVIYKPYTRQEALHARDALAKAIYARLFDWLIDRINWSLDLSAAASNLHRASSAESSAAASSAITDRAIGVLDIFGFECFAHNSFEQLCINFCNEKLQHHFNQHIFEQEQAEYAREGIDACSISFVDNQPCVEALEARSTGLFAMIDEEISIPRGSDAGLLSKVLQRASAHIGPAPVKAKLGRTSFAVSHYAGEVVYDVSGFLEKSKDALHADLQGCMALSAKPLLQAVFDIYDEAANATAIANASCSSNMSISSVASLSSARTTSKSKRKTLGSKFKDQLSFLLASLNATKPHFVRCIKPNDEKQGDIFTSPMVLAQLRYAGLLEVCRIRQLGFPLRIKDADFVHRYAAIAASELSSTPQKTTPPKTPKLLCNVLRACPALFGPSTGCSDEDWRVGKSKVFMRAHLHARLEMLRDEALFSRAAAMQAVARGFLARRAWRAIQTCLENVAQATSRADLEAAILASSDLPHGGDHVHAVQNARARLHKLVEQDRAMSLLRDALGRMEEAALRTAIKVAQAAGLQASSDLLCEAQDALSRVEEARQINAALKKAVDDRDLAALCTLLDKANELGMSPDQHDAVRQATTLQTRLQGEADLARKLDEALASATTSAAFYAILAELTRWGLAKTEKATSAQAIAGALRSVEDAVAARDHAKLQAALADKVALPAANRPQDVADLLDQLAVEDALQDAIRRSDVDAVHAGLAKIDDSAPASLRTQAQRVIQRAEVVSRLRAQPSGEDLAAAVAEALLLQMDPADFPDLQKAQATLETSGDEGAKRAAAVARLTRARDLSGLRALHGAADSPDIQEAVDQVERELAFLRAAAECTTFSEVEVCCLNAQGRVAETTLDAARRIDLALGAAHSLEQLAEMEVLAEDAHLTGMAASIRRMQAQRASELVLERRLHDAMLAEDRVQARTLLEGLDAANKVAQECRLWLDRETDIGQLVEDLEHAMAGRDLDKINTLVDRLLQSGAKLEDRLASELQTLRAALEKQRAACAEVYEETRALQSRAQSPASILAADIDALRGALRDLAARGGDDGALEAARGAALVRKLEAQVEAQAAMQAALDADTYEDLKHALEITQEEELDHLDLAARVRKALRIRERERRAQQRAALDDPGASGSTRRRRSTRAKDDSFEAERKDDGTDRALPTTGPQAAEAAARERQAREERRHRARQARFEFVHFSKIRSNEDYARGVFLHKSRTIRLKCTFQPNSISKSLLDHGGDKELNKIAVRVHKAILGYCRDKAMSFPATMAQDILIKGLDMPEIVDEIYALLCKHLTHNPRPESVGRGWQLLCMCVSTFPPSAEFEPYLLNFFLAHCEVPGLIGNYARFALRRLEGIIHSGPSGFVPMVEEIQAYNDRPPVLARIELADGSFLTEELPVTPDLSVAKVCELCAHFLGLFDPRASCFGLELNDVVPLRPLDFIGDAFIRGLREKTGFRLVYKRIVTVRFGRHDDPSPDDPMYNRLVYLQSQREFVRGKYAGELSCAQVAQLVAIPLAIDRGEAAFKMSAVDLARILPRQYVNADHVPGGLDQLAQEVLKVGPAIAARDPAALQLAFWDQIRPLHSYGTLSFATGQGILVVSDTGIEFDGRVLPFERLHRWGGNASKFTLMIWNPEDPSAEEEKITFATPHSVHIGGALLNFITHIMDLTEAEDA